MSYPGVRYAFPKVTETGLIIRCGLMSYPGVKAQESDPHNKIHFNVIPGVRYLLPKAPESESQNQMQFNVIHWNEVFIPKSSRIGVS